ncbi:UNVERIFIED_CONTAM: WD repeat-containing protein 44 [Sesamum angustifolium]|uniref:WD repeat-containing protein 44 n=1 Tax=Sesamum angustifolium TaxID=2727405 RepID=A0AAW2N5K9_9LAMI
MRRRASTKIRTESGRLNPNALLTKSFRSSKKKGAAILKNIKGVASGLLADKELENSSQVEEKAPKNTSQWIEAHQQGKSYKEFTALHLAQEIQAHEGSIWTIRFNSDGRFLASAGEDRTIHVWEMQECDLIKQGEDPSLAGGGTPPHPTAGNISSDRPPLAEITPMPSEMKRKGKTNGGKPEYVSVPETVQALSEKPVCTFTGHTDEILDLSWSTSQLLLSSSMDKTVRMWDMETKSCLKTFAHNDYVTCIQFNPVDEDYFISGSLDAKVRIWNIPKRKVVDWTDIPEMVTAASYTPDGQIGPSNGHPDEEKVPRQKVPYISVSSQKDPGLQSQSGKITGFQVLSSTSSPKIPYSKTAKSHNQVLDFSTVCPWNPSEVLITATDNRLGIYNGPDLIQKFRGFRNTGSQIAATFSPDGKHVISASEDSQCSTNVNFRYTVPRRQFYWWKRQAKFAPLPKKKNALERNTSTGEDELGDSGPTDPGIGPSDSFSASSDAICYGDSPSISSASSKALGERWK